MGRPHERLRLPLGLLGLALLFAGCCSAQAAPAQAPRGVSRAAAYEASNEAAPPAGFEYQPSDAAFYRALAQQARERFRVNGSFFRDINSTVVPKILGVTNGTFNVLPLNINATPRAEADDDGECLPWCDMFMAVKRPQERCLPPAVMLSCARLWCLAQAKAAHTLTRADCLPDVPASKEHTGSQFGAASDMALSRGSLGAVLPG